MSLKMVSFTLLTLCSPRTGLGVSVSGDGLTDFFWRLKQRREADKKSVFCCFLSVSACPCQAQPNFRDGQTMRCGWETDF